MNKDLTKNVALDFRRALHDKGYTAIVHGDKYIFKNSFILLKAGFGDSVELSVKIDDQKGFIFYLYSHMAHERAQTPIRILDNINRTSEKFIVDERVRKRPKKKENGAFGYVCFLIPKPLTPAAQYSDLRSNLIECFENILNELNNINVKIEIVSRTGVSQISDTGDCISEEDVEKLKNECKNMEKMLWGDDKFNIFDVLGITRMEIRHSTILAWLLDPNENHQLGGWLLNEIMKLAGEAPVGDSDIGSFVAYRENEHIDILLVSHKLQRIVAIENKIGAKEGIRKTRTIEYAESQLTTYETILNKLYPTYLKLFIYLTPIGELPSRENWIPLSYGALIEKVEELLDQKVKFLSDDRRYLIEHYVETIRKDVLMQVDEKVLEKCRELYNTHRAVLKKILEYGKTNIAEQINGILSQFSEAENSPIVKRARDNCFGLKCFDQIIGERNFVNAWWGNEPYVCCVEVNVENNKVCCNVAAWLDVGAKEEIKRFIRAINKSKDPDEWKNYRWIPWNSTGDTNKKNWKPYVDENDMGDTLSEAVEKAVKDVIVWAEKISSKVNTMEHSS